jgi:hypothetical protein
MQLSKALVLHDVPFSSLLYVSKPLAALLTRRWAQILFFLLGIQTMRSASREDPSNLDQEFKFSALQNRATGRTLSAWHDLNSSCDSDCSSTPPAVASISYFGVLINGAVPKIPSVLLCAPDGSLILRYCTAVHWNGWFFVTSSTAPPEYDPVRFVLHARSGAPGARWATAGSSSFARIHISTALFHGAFPTPTVRGARVDLDLVRHRVGSLWFSVVIIFAFAAAGALRREELCEPILATFYGGWALANLARATTYLHAGQRDGAAIYSFLAAMQAGNLLLMINGRWVLLWLWYGGMQIAAAAALTPFGFHGASHPSAFFLPIGPVFVAISAFLTLHRRFTARRAIAIVAADRRAYDVAWRNVVAEHAAELQSLDRSIAQLQMRIKAGGGSEPPRQARQARSAIRKQLSSRWSEAVAEAAEESATKGKAD